MRSRLRRRLAVNSATCADRERTRLLDHVWSEETQSLFVPKPSHRADGQRCGVPDLGTAVRQRQRPSGVSRKLGARDGAGQNLMNLDLNAPGQPLALSRIRPVRVLVRNLLSSCSHGAESMKPPGSADA